MHTIQSTALIGLGALGILFGAAHAAPRPGTLHRHRGRGGASAATRPSR